MDVPFDSSEAAILARVVSPENADLSLDAANSILLLRFPQPDVDRMNELAEKARHGTLSPTESIQIEKYMNAGRILELLQLKARLSLKKAGAAA